MAMTMSSDDDLEHHGIKGQRWGVRRTPEQLGHKTGKKKWRIRMKSSAERKEEQYQRKKAKLDAEDKELKRKEEIRRQEEDLKRRKEALKGDKKEEPKKQTTVPKNKDVKDLSDDELRQILTRYNMEQQYKKMTKEQTEKGKSWVTQMLAEAGKDVAKQYTKKAMTAAMDAAIEKMRRRNQNNSGSGGSSGGGP